MPKIPDNFCILPFIHVHLDEYSNLKLCCVSSPPLKPYNREFDFVNDPDYKNIRERMLAGEFIKQCQTCYMQDSKLTVSPRVHDNTKWFKLLNMTDINQIVPKPIYYDVRNDNTCNLSCRMCYPGYSSQIEKEYTELNLYTIDKNNVKHKLNDVIDLTNIKKIYLAGGEPTLNPDFRSFLVNAINQDKTDLEISITSNGTNLNKEFIGLLSHFKNTYITLSLDGYDQINRYIRWPSNWNSLIKNIKQLDKMKINLSFNITVSIYNISNLSKLVKFLEENFNSPILLNEVFSNTLGAANFPNKELALADLSLLRNTTSYKRDSVFSKKVEYFINLMQTTLIDVNALKEFFKFNDLLDKSRDVKLIDYIPDLDNCRKYIL